MSAAPLVAAAQTLNDCNQISDWCQQRPSPRHLQTRDCTKQLLHLPLALNQIIIQINPRRRQIRVPQTVTHRRLPDARLYPQRAVRMT